MSPTIRVYSGVLKSSSYLYNSSKATRERISRLLQMHANKREEIDTVFMLATFCACASTRRHAVRRSQTSWVSKTSIFRPVISVAIEPKTKADQDKLGVAMSDCAAGRIRPFAFPPGPHRTDPNFRKMGEPHLEIIVDRMLRENVQANVGHPKSPTRNAFARRLRLKAMVHDQTGGRGQYGHCKIELRPIPSSSRGKHEGNVQRRARCARKRSCWRPGRQVEVR